MPQNLDESLEEVQSKIAYLERAVAELSDVVFRQHKEIQVLEVQLNAVRERLDSTRSDEAPRTADHERPPHY
ncbi:MAG: SlyX family protein [Steroidobacteraceae bacterium]